MKTKISLAEFLGEQDRAPVEDQKLFFLLDTRIAPVFDLIAEFVGDDSPYIYADQEDKEEKEQNDYINNFKYENEDERLDMEYDEYQYGPPDFDENEWCDKFLDAGLGIEDFDDYW